MRTVRVKYGTRNNNNVVGNNIRSAGDSIFDSERERVGEVRHHPYHRYMVVSEREHDVCTDDSE